MFSESERKYMGTLTYYGDKDAILEIYHTPNNFSSTLFQQNEVMWGVDTNGHLFTLFHVMMKEKRWGDLTCTTFIVRLVLVGEHVLTLNDTRFNHCIVQFPYLRNWAMQNAIKTRAEGTTFKLSIDLRDLCLVDSEIQEGVRWRLWQRHSLSATKYDTTLTQKTEFEIEAHDEVAIRVFLKQLEEFSQFLSIALFEEQNYSEIKFTSKGTGRECLLLYKKEASGDPGMFSVIKYAALKEKMPTILKSWHSNYDNIAPISSYLINSLQKKNRFDIPDFLIIAHALDGYHKRFVNKKWGKVDHRKYEDGIKILLKQFKDVECLKICRIDPKVLTESRDKYSHLLPDEEKPLAVGGGDLYWLTEKCKILLTCCILNMLGLTNEEINLCCDDLSPLKQITNSFSNAFE